MDKKRTLKEKFLKLNKRKKIQICFAVSLTILLIISLPVAAWFADQKRIESMVKINAPTVLSIGSGGNDTAEMINLSNIDVEKKIGDVLITEGDYVFAVRGKYLQAYDLQISRTTNIPFTYEIYRVSSVKGIEGENDLGKGFGTTSAETAQALKDSANYQVAKYISSNGTTYYYPYSVGTGSVTTTLLLSGSYLNDTTNSKSEIIANNTYHARNYGTYTKGNEYAEPLYWQAGNWIPEIL